MITTYTELVDAVINHLDDDSLTERVAEFIALAEARHKREVRIREMLSRSELTISSRFTSLPSDFLDFKYLRLRSPYQGGRRYVPNFDELNLNELTEVSTNQKRMPRFFTVHDSIEVDSEPDQSYTADLHYYVQLEALSEGATTNALLERAPDVYLYAALMASAPFLVNDERLQTWGELYGQARDELNRSERQSRRGGPLIARISGSTP